MGKEDRNRRNFFRHGSLIFCGRKNVIPIRIFHFFLIKSGPLKISPPCETNRFSPAQRDFIVALHKIITSSYWNSKRINTYRNRCVRDLTRSPARQLRNCRFCRLFFWRFSRIFRGFHHPHPLKFETVARQFSVYAFSSVPG